MLSLAKSRCSDAWEANSAALVLVKFDCAEKTAESQSASTPQAECWKTDGSSAIKARWWTSPKNAPWSGGYAGRKNFVSICLKAFLISFSCSTLRVNTHLSAHA